MNALTIPESRALGSPQSMRAESVITPIDRDEETYSTPLKLGEATVDVEFCMVAGSVYVQGCTVNDEWVDVDRFAQSVGAGWRRDVERLRGAE